MLLILAGTMRMLGWRTAGDATSELWTITLLLKPVFARAAGVGQHGVVSMNKENHDAS